MAIDPNIRHDLHLNGLRAYEAAARLGGFAQAAAELSVTPGAVAAQIKTLEAAYGAPLFERHAKGVRLTALGERLISQFTSAFDALEEAARTLRRESAPKRIHLVTSPALAELWLAPRLRRIKALSSDAQISVTAIEEPPNLKRSPFDICVFYSASTDRGRSVLVQEEVFPVCSPELARKLESPSDLSSTPCLADVVWEDWSIWLAGTGLSRTLPLKGPGFSLYSVSVQQALDGAGVLMGRKSLIQSYLDKGLLVEPFQIRVPLGLAVTSWTLPESKGGRIVDMVAAALKKAAHIAT